MMSFSQYLLSKVAEESVEFTKEVLKGQQQGLYSTHRGMTNLSYIRSEFIDLYARSTVLAICDDIKEQAGDNFELLPIRLDWTEDNMLSVDESINKMCHYALFAYESGHLQLSENELAYVKDHANQYKEHLEFYASIAAPE